MSLFNSSRIPYRILFNYLLKIINQTRSNCLVNLINIAPNHKENANLRVKLKYPEAINT